MLNAFILVLKILWTYWIIYNVLYNEQFSLINWHVWKKCRLGEKIDGYTFFPTKYKKKRITGHGNLH